MAIVNFYRIEIFDIDKEVIVEKDISDILKKYMDNLNDEERFCKGAKCSALLSSYLFNKENSDNQLVQNISFDFSKFTEKKINSAIIANPLEDIDTFDELNKKNIESEKYNNDDISIISEIVNRNKNDYLKIINELKLTQFNSYKIYKILINESIDTESEELGKFSTYFYENNLSRLKKDKTFFNFMKINNTNILSILQNIDGFDCKKILEYLNSHILIKEKIKLRDYPIYEDNFSEILSHSDMKEFNFSYKCTENSILDEKKFNSNFEAIYELFGAKASNHEIKISVSSEKGHHLSNTRILEIFNTLRESGLLLECKVKKANSRSYVDSKSVGNLLKYSTNSKFDSIETANQIFLHAYDYNLNTILDRIDLRI